MRMLLRSRTEEPLRRLYQRSLEQPAPPCSYDRIGRDGHCPSWDFCRRTKYTCPLFDKYVNQIYETEWAPNIWEMAQERRAEPIPS